MKPMRGIGDGVGDAGDEAQPADEHRIHAQAQVEDDHHLAGRGAQQVVGEGARAVGQAAEEGGHGPRGPSGAGLVREGS